jgi:alpha-galactosidase
VSEFGAVDTLEAIVWSAGTFSVEITWTADSAPVLRSVTSGTETIDLGTERPVAEILAASYGHTQASGRLIQTSIGDSLRYSSHDETTADGAHSLDLVMTVDDPELLVTLRLRAYAGVAALRSSVHVRNLGQASVTLQSVTSWSSAFGARGGAAPDFSSWQLLSGRSDWLAEGRWEQAPLRGPEFPVIQQQLTGNQPRGSHSVVSRGSWSTGSVLPVGAVVNDELGIAWLWQVEHNGAWRWEVGENSNDGYIALSGPTELDHDWRARLETGDDFETVPVAVTLGSDLVQAIAHLTAFRRRDRRAHADNAALPVVFNDYMNTLNGDPTTERLLPLIDAAALVGAEVFCIDAGWYDDGGDWWDSVGEWRPSTVRFPGGLGEVIEHIRQSGMAPGLWLEPEVVGVRSPAASTLPDEAFFQRDGRRLVEHERYHLDLRHPAAVAHLDEVVDRLVEQFGVAFFKFDYNIDPGLGTDVAAASVGGGLLAHNRAHLAWLDGVAARHPDLIIENCASGAMRTDWAMLSRLQLQSTSDQQDFRLYPPIAASSPLSMLPEQAASWAYPQPEMDLEEVAFCLATGLLGRYYVSGYLNRMAPAQLALVTEAIATAKSLRADISGGSPFWPSGLPGWDDEWVSLGLDAGDHQLATVWKRAGDAGDTTLSFPRLAGTEVEVITVFPRDLPEWDTSWDAATGTLHVFAPTAPVAARTIELRPATRAVADPAPPATD